MSAKTYFLKATSREADRVNGYLKVRVSIFDDKALSIVVDNEDSVLLTPSQVRKLRRIIDRHYPLATSEE